MGESVEVLSIFSPNSWPYPLAKYVPCTSIRCGQLQGEFRLVDSIVFRFP